VLVPDRAIATDQGQKMLFIVNDKNEVVARPISAGAMHDGLRAIESGLKPGERVIVEGLLSVRPGTIVNPKLTPVATGVPATSPTASVSK
jgi:multidrug efflux pump subunit AcrA (membrane-fusion protein)